MSEILGTEQALSNEASGERGGGKGLWAFARRRKCIAILLGVTILGSVLRTYVSIRNEDVPSDTNAFLLVVGLLRGIAPVETVGLYRLENPLFSLLIGAFNPFSPNWVAASRLAALVPSCLVPATACLIAWTLHRSTWSGTAAGVVSAMSW